MSQQNNEPIAIVGSACRFAGGTDSPSKLWEMLREPPDLLRQIPDGRFSPAGFYHANGSQNGRTNTRHAYFLNESPAAFDAEFFGIKPVEAKAIDPQQRFLMEIAYEALESAGITMDSLRGSDTGVYVGSMCSDYVAMVIRDLSDLPTYTATGTADSLLSNRLSYFFDWHGPSMTLDTACSSSLVAVHLAVQALRSRECGVALACGSNLILGPENFIIESKLKMLSPDGRSRMWDQGANGYARGEGVAALVLKPLHAALRDNDHIECIIRETALNHDGALNSAGITIPNASAQEALIRATYAKAGLDLRKSGDRPQFFEAHGTGTLVGDPTEAEAIYNALSTDGQSDNKHDTQAPLYVGSIKTVLGHTESTAGIAAIMKASLSLSNSLVPPNLLFDRLSASVAPFYKGIEIPVIAKPWPIPVQDGGTRRASVNSFGFGGVNAHAILESYDTSKAVDIPTFAPYVFSAFSEQSLRASLSAYATFLNDAASETSPRDLCWTLRKRRSAFLARTAFPASSIAELKANINVRLTESTVTTKALPASKKGRILGIFTGQGAQYPRMAAELIENSALVSTIIDKLEASLKRLPDGPDWSLKNELLADASISRAYEGAISQPLCTAVQILLVDLLRLAGIEFDAVVGHSSGEIAAAYAAGYITADDAIRIAYYRGVHLRHALSAKGQNAPGAMIAVGSSAEDLEELCQDPVFSGRISIAACNSPTSFTISGDEDAIAELEVLLDDEDKFHRRLKVDMAYHSRHMFPCSQPYVASLRRCGVQQLLRQESSHCTWVSSVYGFPTLPAMDLTGTYWADNLTQPVLFSQALENAFELDDNPFDLVLELGPHPALKGPSIQTIQNLIQQDVPYSGLLTRGVGSIEALSSALGFAWSHLESGRVDLDHYDRALTGSDDGFRLVKNLPTYCWNHNNEYWHESRVSRRLRNRKDPVHSLLGDATPDSAAHHMSWRHRLRVPELEWISGHRVQGQIVFPAAGYLATALEAARLVANARAVNIRLLEISDFIVHQAVVFDREDTSIEVLTQLADIEFDKENNRIRSKFTYSAALPSNPDELTLAASGCLDILIGPNSSTLLPIRKPMLSHMVDVEEDRFYQALADLGYEFSGRFRSLSELRRRHLRSSCLVKMHDPGDLLINPAELDAVIQSCILAYSYPYDEQFRTPHLPTKIHRVRVNPAVLLDSWRSQPQDLSFNLEATIRRKEMESRGICGDVDMYPGITSNGAIQVRGATFLPLGAVGEDQDRKMFSKVQWIDMVVDGSAIAQTIPLTDEHSKLLLLLERIATFYLRTFDKSIAPDDPLRSQFPTNHYLNYARHVASMCEVDGGLERQAWLQDTLEDILQASSAYSGVVDVEMMHLVGTQMPRVFRGETTMLEEFRAGGSVGILDRYYAEGFSLRESAQWVSRAVKQLANRYPSMNILEIGAGTGGATKAIFREIGQSFRSYTYTDISAAFFENASHIFAEYADRMEYRTLDAEKDVLQQGYHEGGYDLIVAFFVIHATSNIEQALRNIRQLLRPGGFLVVGEGHDGENYGTAKGFIFGTLPGWWLGAGKDGRDLSPLLPPDEWDHLLRKTGFSGVDTAVPLSWGNFLNSFHFVTQAIDDQVNFFREPFTPSAWRIAPIEKLIIIGGQSSRSSHIVEGLKLALSRGFASEIHFTKSLIELDHNNILDTNATVLSLTELDNPVFKDITPEGFEALKKVFGSGKRLFWVTSGRLDREPFSNMTVGFGRVAVSESPDLRLQQLDIRDPESVDPHTVAEIFLRFYASEFQDSNLLWSLEPEIVLENETHQFLARLLPVPELNDRYNSSQRAITHERRISEAPIVLKASSTGYIVRDISAWNTSVSDSLLDAEDLLELCISHATLKAVRTTLGHKFLALGARSTDGAAFLTLVPSLASVATISRKSAFPVTVLPGSEKELLEMMYVQLVAMTVLDPLYEGQTVVVQDAGETITAAFVKEAAARNIEIVFISSRAKVKPDEDNDDRPYTSSSELSTYSDSSYLCDMDTIAYVHLGTDNTVDATSDTNIPSWLPNHCRVETNNTLFSTTGSHSRPSLAPILGKTLERAFQSIQDSLSDEIPFSSDLPLVQLTSLVNGHLPEQQQAIVDFNSNVTPIQASRLDAQPMFKGRCSTYWIVGLSGALGVSLCDWILDKGAKNIVITSRRPDISAEWISEHKKRGANIMVVPCDITNETEIVAAHEKIRKSLPPIVGVINGAMVLRDVSIDNMTFEQLSEVTKPKVEGSIHLDRLFYHTNLDFFILVSSINCVIGSWGQANYAAANMFMCGLAGERRKRGYRAAVVNVGAIIGAGYMERESRRALDAIVQKLHMMRLSEEDWHQAIGEAIDSSRLESPHGPELTTGLSEVSFDVPVPPIWFSNPKFSGFITQKQLAKEEIAESKERASLQDDLLTCSSEEDLHKIINNAFAAQLRNILQVTMSDDDIMASRSSDLGLDSLISVDIRSWFLKSLQVSMPALKIMGNNTMASLTEYAIEAMPPSLVPHMSALKPPDTREPEENLATSVTVNGVKAFDWEIEATPPSTWDSIPFSIELVSCQPKTIVLTGVTGLLGHHLLDHLLKSTPAQMIHCLAVRRLSNLLQNKKLRNDPRVRYYPGDLSDPLLGLSEEDALSIFGSADVVIHNGADTSHTKSYSDIQAANVGSTKTLVRLCLPRRVPFHYISSAGVAIYYNQPAFPEVSVTSTRGTSRPPPADGAFGYGCSKWVIERLLERTNAEFGLPVHIYRPSTIIRDGADACAPRAQLDWVNALLHYIRVLGAAPKLEHNLGALDLVRVETCCADVIQNLTDNNGGLERGPRYVHLVGDVVIPLDCLCDVDSDVKKRYDLLPLQEWIGKAIAAGLHPGVALLIEEMDTPGQKDYPRLLRDQKC